MLTDKERLSVLETKVRELELDSEERNRKDRDKEFINEK